MCPNFPGRRFCWLLSRLVCFFKVARLFQGCSIGVAFFVVGLGWWLVVGLAWFGWFVVDLLFPLQSVQIRL